MDRYPSTRNEIRNTVKEQRRLMRVLQKKVERKEEEERASQCSDTGSFTSEDRREVEGTPQKKGKYYLEREDTMIWNEEDLKLRESVRRIMKKDQGVQTTGPMENTESNTIRKLRKQAITLEDYNNIIWREWSEENYDRTRMIRSNIADQYKEKEILIVAEYKAENKGGYRKRIEDMYACMFEEETDEGYMGVEYSTNRSWKADGEERKLVHRVQIETKNRELTWRTLGNIQKLKKKIENETGKTMAVIVTEMENVEQVRKLLEAIFEGTGWDFDIATYNPRTTNRTEGGTNRNEVKDTIYTRSYCSKNQGGRKLCRLTKENKDKGKY